jgi:hypothetical protein
MRLVLRYDSGPGHVEIAVDDVAVSKEAVPSPHNQSEVSAIIPAGARVQVRKLGASDLKLRKVSLEPLK